MLGPFTKDAPLTIAVSKGRVGNKFIEMLMEAGYDCTHHSDRSLLATDKSGEIRILYAKSSDVLTYVERAVADLGVVGNDLLLEKRPRVYELAELPIGRCRICIAGKKQQKAQTLENREGGILRIATKYPALAKAYLQEKGIQGEIILLNGSVELGPLLGLSDVILDIVETGKTLADNGLEIYEALEDVSTRLVANKAYYKTRYALCTAFLTRLEEAEREQKGETA